MENKKQKQLLIALLREDFKSFVEKVFNEVAANSVFQDNWHIDVICSELIKMMNGEQNKLIINIPPRSLKSIICSVALPAYILGKNPKASIICASYSDSLASKLALDTRKVIESDWYKEVFPLTRLSLSKKAINDFETTQGGGRYATSVEGTLTGRGANYLIVDDPIKPEDANSDLIREKVNNWYGSTLYSRLNDKKTGNVLIIMQRIHQNDFTGYLLETDKDFKLLKLPAIAEENEIWTVKNPIVGIDRVYTRKIGEALHPAREDIDMLSKTKSTVGNYTFASQYQQNPTSRGASLIRPEWLQKTFKTDNYKLHHYCYPKIHGKIKRIVMSWDTAMKAEQDNDYSACVVMARTDMNEYLLLEVYREKLEFPELLKKMKSYKEEIHIKYRYLYGHEPKILVEEAGSGFSIIQALRKDFKIYAEAIRPEKDKATRLKGVSYLLETGRVFFPEDKPAWWKDFERELLAFPNSKYDDQCDAFSQALIEISKGSNMWFLSDME
jgi:phage uncharacterized protein (putative large terminase), C-terminal domain